MPAAFKPAAFQLFSAAVKQRLHFRGRKRADALGRQGIARGKLLVDQRRRPGAELGGATDAPNCLLTSSAWFESWAALALGCIDQAGIGAVDCIRAVVAGV